MKVTSIRCGICDTWNIASRNHCYFCGATRAMKVMNRVLHFNYTALMQGKNVQMVRGTWSNLTLKNLAAKPEKDLTD